MPAQKKIPRVKFFIEDRVNTKGEATIYIRYFLQRYAKRSTGINIPPKAWDEKTAVLRHPSTHSVLLREQSCCKGVRE